MPHYSRSYQLCPHCQQQTQSWHHIERCPARPEIFALTAATLADPDHPGYALSSGRYSQLARAVGSTSQGALSTQYGRWGDVVRAYGLLPAEEMPKPPNRQHVRVYRSYTDPALCPHCNGEYRSEALAAQHAAKCPRRPGLMELVRSLVEMAEYPGVGCDSGEYLRRCDTYRHSRQEDDTAPPALSTLERHFGNWPAVLRFLGLRSMDDLIEERAKADNDRHRAQMALERRLEVESWGLPVASVQKPQLWVTTLRDGRKATMIR